jgi:hypothetical protein
MDLPAAAACNRAGRAVEFVLREREKLAPVFQ